MAARIFISYRTADGMDKAVALARDLGRVFGDDSVFLDKDDLRGGSAWRDEIGRTLEAQPVLLLLLTPLLIEAVGPDGKLRIADPNDPVSRELRSAMDVGAQVIPLLCDGLAAPPDASHLPEPFNRIGELTWRKLRAYDWAHDVARIVDDLRAFGVAPAHPPAATPPAHAPAPPRPTGGATRMALAALVAALALGGAWWLLGGRAPGASAPAPVASTAGARAALEGRWNASLSRGEQVVVVVSQSGDRLTLASEPIAIATRSDWAEYRAFWRERTGSDLNAVMYRGEGLLVSDPGVAPRIDIALTVMPSPGPAEAVDGGNLSATLAPDGRSLAGTIWLNSLQAEQPASLTRLP
jgi:TIR domain